MPISIAAASMPGKARHATEHADREDPADIVAADRRLDRLDDDQQRSGDRGGRDRDAKGDPFDPARIGRHQLQRQPVLRYRQDGAADECAPEKELQDREHQKRHEERDQHAQRQFDKAEMQAGADIGRLDKAVVDAEDQDQADLADKQQAEEEGETLNRFFAALLEGIVIDLVDDRSRPEKIPAPSTMPISIGSMPKFELTM